MCHKRGFRFQAQTMHALYHDPTSYSQYSSQSRHLCTKVTTLDFCPLVKLVHPSTIACFKGVGPQGQDYRDCLILANKVWSSLITMYKGAYPLSFTKLRGKR